MKSIKKYAFKIISIFNKKSFCYFLMLFYNVNILLKLKTNLITLSKPTMTDIQFKSGN